MNNKIAMIFGVSGQDGNYLTKHLIEKGYNVIGVVRRSSQPRPHLNKLIELGLIVEEGDVTDYSSIFSLIMKYKPDHIYNLAAQSHVGSSFNQPLVTSDIVAKGPLNLLEIIRLHHPTCRFYQASSSEMFGSSYSLERDYDQYSTIEHFNFKEHGDISDEFSIQYKEYSKKFHNGKIFNVCIPFQYEETPFLPQSPYAISKLFAHNMTRLYRECYNIFACSGILFNHESEQRGEQFVTRKITRYVGRLLNFINNSGSLQEPLIKENYIQHKYSGLKFSKLKLGNLNAKRDWSHSSDMVKAMVLMLESNKADDYVVGSGDTHSIKEFLEEAFSLIGLDWKNYVEIDQSLFRPSEVDYLRANPTKIKEALKWTPKYSFKDLVKSMVEYDIELAKNEKP